MEIQIFLINGNYNLLDYLEWYTQLKKEEETGKPNVQSQEHITLTFMHLFSCPRELSYSTNTHWEIVFAALWGMHFTYYIHT